MASIRRLTTGQGEARYQVRYRDPAGTDRAKHFRRLDAARKFQRQVEMELERGDWIDPHAARTNFGDVAEAWLTAGDFKDSTRSGYRSVLDRHLLPRFATTPIAGITTPEIEQFLTDKRSETPYNKTGRTTSASTIRNVRNTLSGVMTYAVRAGYIRTNPVSPVPAPKDDADHEMRFLTPAQVTALADAIDPRYRLAVILDAYTGLRAGELWALEVGRVDLLRRRITVAAGITEVHGAQVSGKTKNRQTRTVPIPRFIADALTEHLAPIAEDPDAYVFTAPNGGPVRHSHFYDRQFQPAAVAVGLGEFIEVKPPGGKPRRTPTGRVSKAKPPRRYEGLRFHDLRHTAVSFMIAAGASPLVISRAIGHGSIRVTYDVYGHILPDHADDLADGLDAIHAGSAAPVDSSVSRLRPAK